jgi:RNA polymerase sigma factor (TIGR02999 family)
MAVKCRRYGRQGVSVSPGSSNPLTQLLVAAGSGDSSAQDLLWATVYDELRRLAHAQLRAEHAGAGLQTTLLVHEAYLRLVGDVPVDWNSRGHFFSAAANAMRRIRVDDARKRGRHKRGGGRRPGELGEQVAASDCDPAGVLALDEALQRLAQHDRRKAEVVTLRFFGGLSVDETAEALGISPRTVDSEWRFARAWLHHDLSG